MTTYYCDLEVDFVERTGLDGSTNVLTGPGGFQAAIRGDGTDDATALAAGDTLWIKGTATLARLIYFDCDSTGVSGWDVGDTVVDNNTGSEWAGKVAQRWDNVETGLASNNICLIQLDSSYESNDVVVGNGINNTTKVETYTLSGIDTPGIQYDGSSGADAVGNIKIYGTIDFSDPSGNREQAILEALSAGTNVTNCFSTPTAIRLLELSHITIQNSSASGLNCKSQANTAWIINHCLFKNCAGAGAAFYKLGSSTISNCIARDNGDFGLNRAYSISLFINCVASGNSGGGIELYYGGELVNCLAYENTGHNLEATRGSTNLVLNCVGDGSIAGSGIRISNISTQHCAILESRFTNNNQYGLEDVTGEYIVHEDWNVIFNNRQGERLGNIPLGLNTNNSPVDDGYSEVKYLYAFDGGSGASFVVDEEVTTAGGQSAYIRAVTGAASATGTITVDTCTGGMLTNNDSITGQTNGKTANINGDLSVDTANYNIKTGAEIRSLALVLNWDGI